MNTHKDKSPAFQFYAQDWLADFKVRCLTYEQKGIYIELLAMSWIEPLTSDLNRLAIAMRLQEDSLAMIIDQFFYKDGDFFYNKKLEKYRAEKIKFIKNKQKAGKAGADKRWSKTKTKPKQTYSTPIADPMANDSSSSSTSSSTSTNISKDIYNKPKGLETSDEVLDNIFLSESVETTTPPSSATPPFEEVFNYFEDSFKTKVLAKNDSRKKKISARLKTFSLEQIKDAIYGFSISPFYIGVNDRGWKADLDYIIRSDENIEKGIKLKESQPPKKELPPLKKLR